MSALPASAYIAAILTLYLDLPETSLRRSAQDHGWLEGHTLNANRIRYPTGMRTTFGSSFVTPPNLHWAEKIRFLMSGNRRKKK